ncbi:lipopolysaccharide-binding protein-like [Clavelina lepadiformis]|uniref:lipopolysaccharide-binding protein-like n=1 Tax=Clavelina lepadiformis TaxID=159417 RepID=UPI0040422E65
MKIYNAFVAFCCVTVFAAFVASQSQEHPGLKVSVSTSGLNFLKDLVVKALDDELQNVNLPTQQGSKGVSYKIENIVANKIRLGKTSVRTLTPNVFQVKANNAGLEVNADWEVWKRIKILFLPAFTVRGSGSIRARTSGVNIEQNIIVERTANGKPKFTVSGCSIRIGRFSTHVDVDNLPSQIDSVLNLLIDPFEGLIKRELEKRVCGLVRPGLQSLGDKLTRNFELNFPFVFDTKIDLGLACDPSSTGHSGLVCLNGKSYPEDRPDVVFPFPAPVLSEVSDSSHMVRISISPYAPNTLLHSLYLQNRFKKTFSPKDVASVFGVSLPVGAIARLLKPVLGSNPPPIALYAKLVQFTVEANHSPMTHFTPEGIEVSGNFKITISAIVNGQPQKLADFSINVMALVGVSVENGRIKASIKSLGADASSSGGLPVHLINPLLKKFLPQLILPAINGITEAGFKIPTLYGLKFINPVVETKLNALEVASDFMV